MPLSKNPKYDLKKKYVRVFEIGIILSLSFLILAFKYFPEVELKITPINIPEDPGIVIEIPRTDPRTQIPPPPKPAIPIEAVSEDDMLPDVDILNNELDEGAKVKSTPIVFNDPDDGPVTAFEYFAVVEEMPSPIGGIKAIMQKIRYPELARRAGIQGKVYIRAYVNENGYVEKAELINSVGGGCDEEALKAVLATKFNPGKQRGKPVKVIVSIPIHFKIQ